jgi:Rab proteins geranylgeranyltransferase component A
VELDYDESIHQSRLLYAKMYPDDEFLPKAPEPEEIVMPGDEDAGVGNINLGALADLIEEGVEVKEVREKVDEAKEAIVSEDHEEAKEAIDEGAKMTEEEAEKEA